MNKLIILFFLLISLASPSIAQNEPILIPKSKVPSKPLPKSYYSMLGTSQDITLFRWRQNILTSSPVNGGKRDLVCFDSNDRIIWSHEYENISAFDPCNTMIICTDSLSYAYLLDPGIAYNESSGKDDATLMNVYRFDESGEFVKKEIKIADFNGSAKTTYVAKDFSNISSAVVSKGGFLCTVSTKSRDGLRNYICRLNNESELTIIEILSEYPYSASPKSDEGFLRTISLRNDTLILMHCFKDKFSNVKLRLFFYDVFNLEKSQTADYYLRTSTLGSFIRAVEPPSNPPGLGASSPDGVVSYPSCGHMPGLLSATTLFSLDAHIVVDNIEGGLILYGFCGDKKGAMTEKGIWYAQLPFANNGEEGSVQDVTPTAIQIDGIDLKNSECYISTGTIDLSYSANRLIFSYQMKKNGHSIGDKSAYKNYFTLFK